MATARKLPSGNYRVRVHIGGGSYKSFTARTKKEAEFMATEYLHKLKKDAADMTVSEAITKYIDSKSNVLSPTTVSSYRGIARNNFQGIMQIKLKVLTSEDIQAEINNMAKNLSAKTISNAYGLLSATLKTYHPSLIPNVTLPQKQRKIKRLLPAETIYNAVKGTEIELPVLMAMWLGMRMSEIRGLKRSSITDDGCLIVDSVIVTVDGKHIEKTNAKTSDSKRKIKIPKYILSLINQSDSEYLVELTGQAIYKRFIRLLDKHHLPHMTFHDLRHVNASVMVQLGVPDKYAMERGGWSTTSTLKSVYQHTFTTEREIIDKRIDDYFNNICHEK